MRQHKFNNCKMFHQICGVVNSRYTTYDISKNTIINAEYWLLLAYFWFIFHCTCCVNLFLIYFPLFLLCKLISDLFFHCTCCVNLFLIYFPLYLLCKLISDLFFHCTCCVNLFLIGNQSIISDYIFMQIWFTL